MQLHSGHFKSTILYSFKILYSILSLYNQAIFMQTFCKHNEQNNLVKGSTLRVKR